MATAHNQANLGDFAKTVLMPGDPLRAKFVAENYLDNFRQVNSVRGMLGFTGTYKGKEVSVMGSGMGIPSIGIYSYELFNFYDVDNIIRIGSAGAYSEDVKIRDIVLGMGACTDSNYANQFKLPGTFAPIADFGLLLKAYEAAKKKGIDPKVGNIVSSDTFYDNDPDDYKKWKDMGVLAVEMEAAAIYINAAKAKKHALCILTISDHIVTKEETTSEEREKTFTDMMEIALELA